MKFIASFSVGVYECVLAIFDAAFVGNNDPTRYGFHWFDKPQRCQTFAWAPGNVNFATLDGELSEALVEVYMSDHIQLCEDTVRAIQVPFSTGEQGVACFNWWGTILAGTASIMEGWGHILVPIPPSQYALIYEVKFRNDEDYLKSDEYRSNEEVGLSDLWCRLTFIPQENAEPAILRADEAVRLERNRGLFCMGVEPMD
jgi:hypothetical protein